MRERKVAEAIDCSSLSTKTGTGQILRSLRPGQLSTFPTRCSDLFQFTTGYQPRLWKAVGACLLSRLRCKAYLHTMQIPAFSTGLLHSAREYRGTATFWTRSKASQIDQRQPCIKKNQGLQGLPFIAFSLLIAETGRAGWNFLRHFTLQSAPVTDSSVRANRDLLSFA